jgi:hypothetical protein
MTTEERMKIYREKYGNLQAQKKRQDPREEFSSEKKNFQQKNRKKSAGKNYASGAKNSAVKNNAKKSERKFRGEKKDDAKIQPKKSIASKIKSFFSKKK